MIIIEQIVKRFSNDSYLLAGVVLGVALAIATTVSGLIYVNSLESLAYRNSINQLPGNFLGIDLFAKDVVLSKSSIDKADNDVDKVANENFTAAYKGAISYSKSSVYLAGTPLRKLPYKATSTALIRGYLQSVSQLDDNSIFTDGRIATTQTIELKDGPQIEAVITAKTASNFGLQVGDKIKLAVDLGVIKRVSVIVSGIFEPADLTNEYWRKIGIYLNPSPLLEPPPYGVRIDPNEPPLGLFVQRETLATVVDTVSPDTLINPVWFLKLDKEAVANWPLDKANQHIRNFKNDITSTLPSISVRSGSISNTIKNVERRGFLSNMPLLLLLAGMVATVLFYISMVVSFLTKRRGRDVSLVRSRGAGKITLLTIYGIEGIVLVITGSILGVAIALGIVLLTGKLPYLADITDGGLLTIQWGLAPFIAGLVVSVASLVIFVVPSISSARSGILGHKFLVSRPPTTSMLQRYYLDVAILFIGGLIFWELYRRGEFVSGGLFDTPNVNEPLLLAPAIYLIAVALSFLRIFPMLLNYFSGENNKVIGLLAVISVGVLIAEIILVNGPKTILLHHLWALGILASFLGLYFITGYFQSVGLRISSIFLQSCLVFTFLFIDYSEWNSLISIPNIGLILIVPLQIGFVICRLVNRRSPVWISLTLWRMSRNPLQYTWVMLLLVLVSGLSILATTVGGTLEQNRRESVLYEVGSDIRVTASPLFIRGGIRSLGERYESHFSVEMATIGLRTSGVVGDSNIEVLGVDSSRFNYVSWFREDFSNKSLEEMMGRLHSYGREGIDLPDKAEEIGVWVKSLSGLNALSLWIVLIDGNGETKTLSMGKLDFTGWEQLKSDIPTGLERPVRLVSIQVFEPGSGPGEIGHSVPSATPGGLILDDIFVNSFDGSQFKVIEDFEGSLEWVPIVSSYIPSDNLINISGDVYMGKYAGLFTFGAYKNMSVRSIWYGRGSEILPVVLSRALANKYGFSIGQQFIIEVAGRLVVAEMSDVVNYFPTMDTRSSEFIITDANKLQTYLNVISTVRKVDLNELFISVKSGSEHKATSIITGDSGSDLLDINHGLDKLEELSIDPYSGSGFKPMVLMAAIITLISAGFGYVNYLFLFAKITRNEITCLQSLGLSRLQLYLFMAIEHSIIIVCGISLGTWSGYQISDLMVSPLAVNDSGTKIIPRFILDTDWGIMGPWYVILTAFFVLSGILLTRFIAKMDINQSTRIDGA